jgi:hypothetical protein
MLFIVALIVSALLLLTGLTGAIVDIETFGWGQLFDAVIAYLSVYYTGLYLILVSVVAFIVIVAFCLVGTEEQTQPTIAKQVWTTTRQTLRTYTPLLSR